MISSLRTGQTLKHYAVLHKIGQGGMGQVYKAEDKKLGRFVAVKLLPEDAAQSETARHRLLQEARSASLLNHPGIVTIHSIEEHEGVDFIVMEYVEGETLRAEVERGPLPLARLLDLGAQLADALAAAHSKGIIHRDIKSENILLTPRGHVKVLDFGLAKPFEPATGEVNSEAPTRLHLTGEGAVIGTVLYMSPEQTRAETLDARTDIFSLGCVLYEAATARLPFGGASLLTVMQAIVSAEPPAPSRLRAELPIEFDFIIERALAKDKARRYASAAELAEALRVLSGTTTTSLRVSAERLAVPTSDAGRDLPVGRTPELERLGGLLRRAVEGTGRVAFVTGEPGIGKSALVGEFVRRGLREHPGLVVSRGRCVEQYGTGEAYLPFLDAVGGLLTGPNRERIVALLRTYAPTWCLQFPAAFVSSLALEKLQQETAGATKERMLREMGDMLAALAAQSPVALVLEDLHWADPSSVDLLRHLSHRVGDQRLLILGTYRPGDVELNEHPLKPFKLEMEAHSLCDEIALGSLARRHVACYIDARFAPNDFPPELTALIYAKTEGHPLFVNSLAQFLVERGDIIHREAAGWSLSRPLAETSLEAPENVRSMIRKKLESLGEEDRRALQYASVEGEEFLSTVLAGLLGVDDIELEERLAHVERAYRLIETAGEEELPDGSLATRYRFAHALYQNVLYGDLVSKRRRLLHRQAGERLERHYGKQSARIAAQLAVHFERGHDHARAVQYLARAGDNAANLYASSEAAENYGRAIELADKLPDEERAEPLIALYRKRGRANLALGKFGEAVEDFTEMLDEARRAGSPEQESAALNALSMTLFYSHRLDEITERADEILRAAERAQSDALRIEAMQVLALKHLGSGDLVEAKPMLDEIIPCARRLSHKSVLLTGLAWRGILHFFQTEYAEAEAMLLEARALAEELHDPFLLLEGYFVLGMVRGNMGRMTEALQTFEEGLETAARFGDQFWSTRIPNCIGWIYRELQEFDKAVEYDQQGLEVGRKRGVLEAQANSLINLGIDHNQAGRGEKTASAFREVEQIFRRDAWFRWRYQIRLHAGTGEHQLAQGNLARAEEHAHKLLETATHYEAHKYVAVAHKLLAEIAVARGDHRKAAEELDAALRELRTRAVPIVEWKTYAALGRLRALEGDHDAAREAFQSAAAAVGQIADNVRDEELRRVFLDSPPVRELFAGAGLPSETGVVLVPSLAVCRRDFYKSV